MLTVTTLPRYGLLARVLMVLLLVGMGGFFGAMAVLVSHHSELRCEMGGVCTHVERYPFGLEVAQPVPPISGADVEWSPGGRSKALKLVLTHQDGSFTEYQGVGKNGERAERTARALNAFLDAPSAPKTFALREGSLVVAAFLLVLALGALVFVPSFFTTVRLARTGGRLEVRIGRWPAPARVLTLELPPGGFGLRLVQGATPEQLFFAVEAAGVELGMRFQTQAGAQARVEQLNAWWLG